ncbi:MAG: hypothetical protein JW863_21530 [Chitinispirillaceae bacterium]|nr:hypothetical protein [Chitinispirillaceae bacterium]
MRTYRYHIEYLEEAEAADINAAKNSGEWRLYADRSENTVAVSPVVDSSAVTARYVKLTLLSGDIPKDDAQIRTIVETDYANRLSVFEFKVFEDIVTGVTESTTGYRKTGEAPGYTVHRKGIVEIVFTDFMGKIRRRRTEERLPGSYALTGNSYGMVPGVYVVSVKTPETTVVRKVRLVR